MIARLEILEVEPGEGQAPWGARIVGSEGISGHGPTPALALIDLAASLQMLSDGGAALIRTARPQLEIPA